MASIDEASNSKVQTPGKLQAATTKGWPRGSERKGEGIISCALRRQLHFDGDPVQQWSGMSSIDGTDTSAPVERRKRSLKLQTPNSRETPSCNHQRVAARLEEK